MKKGELRLVVGNMFANKTGHLLLELKTLQEFGRKDVICFKPMTDTRSGKGRYRSRAGEEREAIEVPAGNPWVVAKFLRRAEAAHGRRFDIVAFDEVQFFPGDSGFVSLVRELLASGYDVFAAGLPLDFRGEPFGSTLLLTWFAQQNCIWLTAYCTKCGAPAPFIQRLIKGAPAPYDSPQVQVGDKESYEPRCADHFSVPERPHRLSAV